jgi:hypothetical protein
VTGTSGTQTTSVQMNLLFEDYTLTVTPNLRTIEAGDSASYTVIINPVNGFNQQVTLTCANSTSTSFPPDATCIFANSGQETPNGTSPLSVPLTINTVKYVAPSAVPPWGPSGKLPPIILGLLTLLAIASLALGKRRRAPYAWLGSGWLGVRLAIVSLILAMDLALVGCRSSTLLQSGTTVGNYTITINGTLTSNTAVLRTAQLNLAVTSTIP